MLQKLMLMAPHQEEKLRREKELEKQQKKEEKDRKELEDKERKAREKQHDDKIREQWVSIRRDASESNSILL